MADVQRASIQGYLHTLEARLAPSLDAQALQERLTEAENHLRDRAQEFEEVGLPPTEAEARAVAAFGAPEEYAEDVPMRTAPPAAVSRPAPRPTRDLALQLAWSAVGLGVVAMLIQDHAAETAGGAVVAIFGLGALFGRRPTSIRRMGLLAVASATAAFLVMVGFYEPMPSNGFRTDRIGVRLRGSRTDVDWAYRMAKRSLDRFDRARAAHDHGLEATVDDMRFGWDRRGGFVGPATVIEPEDWSWNGESGYLYALDSSTLRDYDTLQEANEAWKRDGDLVGNRLQEAVAKAKPIDPDLSETAFTARCGLVALAGGVAFLASMVGAQALALGLRAFFVSLFAGFRRRPEPPTRAYGEPERS